MTKYVTIPELAKLLGKHRFSIYLKVCKGEIKSERAGRMYLIPRSEVERLAEGTTPKNESVESSRIPSRQAT